MTREFDDVNFRRDFARRMTASEHDQSFDAFVREIRKSSEAVNLNEGWTQVAESAQFAVPRNPNQYSGTGRWTESKRFSVLGLPAAYGAAADPVMVETYKASEDDAALAQQTAYLYTGEVLRRAGSAITWSAWRKASDSSHVGSVIITRNAAYNPNADFPGTTWEKYAVGQTLFGQNAVAPAFAVVDQVGGNKDLVVPRDGWGTFQVSGGLPEPTTLGRLVTGAGKSEGAEKLESIGHADPGDRTVQNANLPPYIVVIYWTRTA